MLPLPLTHGESGRHVGPLGGRETLEKKCSRVEARAQSRKNIQMEKNSMHRSKSKWVEKPSTPEVLQVIQKGWRVGRARRWRTGRLAGLTVRHRILPIGDGEVRKVTLPLKKRNKGPVQTSPLDGLVWQQYRRGTRTGQNWRQGNILKRVTLHKNPPKLGINY